MIKHPNSSPFLLCLCSLQLGLSRANMTMSRPPNGSRSAWNSLDIGWELATTNLDNAVPASTRCPRQQQAITSTLNLYAPFPPASFPPSNSRWKFDMWTPFSVDQTQALERTRRWKVICTSVSRFTSLFVFVRSE